MELCNRDCNNCPIVNHPNSRMLTKVLNALFDEFGDGAYDIVQENCPNLTVCYDCRIDDFCHHERCEIWSDDDMTPNSGNGAVRFCVSGCFGVQRTPPRQRQRRGSAGLCTSRADENAWAIETNCHSVDGHQVEIGSQVDGNLACLCQL